MPRSLLFWVIYVLAVLFTFYFHWVGYREGGQAFYIRSGMSVVEFVLIGLLGWQVFGPAVKG